MLVPILLVIAAAFVLFSLSVFSVKQAQVGVVTRFGKFKRLAHPGMHFKWPLLEAVHTRVSLQNRSVELEFAAISADQAMVNFKTLILFAARDQHQETVLRIAFKFIDDKSFMQTLVRSIEGSIRAFVATKNQSEILRLRQEIVASVHDHLEASLNDWGYRLLDLQVNDVSFDEAIMRSMAQVVASGNMLMAANNEAQAQYITKTKLAEAESAAIRLKAEAERDAYGMRGAGNAAFRQNAALGLKEAAATLDAANVPANFMLYTMWLDALKYIAQHGQGNVLSFDATQENFEKSLLQLQKLGATSPTKE